VRFDERRNEFDERLVEVVERLVKLDERPIKVLERLKTSNGRGLTAWEPLSRGSLKTEEAGRVPSPGPLSATIWGGPTFLKCMPPVAETSPGYRSLRSFSAAVQRSLAASPHASS